MYPTRANGIIVLLNSQPSVLLNFVGKRPESDVTSNNFMLNNICRIHFHIRSNAGIMTGLITSKSPDSMVTLTNVA